MGSCAGSMRAFDEKLLSASRLFTNTTWQIIPTQSLLQIVTPKKNQIINVVYSVPTTECKSAVATLERELRISQSDLNKKWDSVCQTSDCSDAEIDIKCGEQNRKKRSTETVLNVYLTLKDIDVSNVKQTVPSKENVQPESHQRKNFPSVGDNVKLVCKTSDCRKPPMAWM